MKSGQIALFLISSIKIFCIIGIPLALFGFVAKCSSDFNSWYDKWDKRRTESAEKRSEKQKEREIQANILNNAISRSQNFFRNRDYQASISAYEEILNIPHDFNAIDICRYLAALIICGRYEQAMIRAEEVMSNENFPWYGTPACYIPLWQLTACAGTGNRAEFKRLGERAVNKMNPNQWPYPILLGMTGMLNLEASLNEGKETLAPNTGLFNPKKSGRFAECVAMVGFVKLHQGEKLEGEGLLRRVAEEADGYDRPIQFHLARDYIHVTQSSAVTLDNSAKPQHNILKGAQFEINRVYAKYGMTFSNTTLQKYFNDQEWYTPRPQLTATDIDQMMTRIDAQIIIKLANSR